MAKRQKILARQIPAIPVTMVAILIFLQSWTGNDKNYCPALLIFYEYIM